MATNFSSIQQFLPALLQDPELLSEMLATEGAQPMGYEDLIAGGFGGGAGGGLGSLIPPGLGPAAAAIGGGPMNLSAPGATPGFNTSGFLQQGLPNFLKALGALQQPGTPAFNPQGAPGVALPRPSGTGSSAAEIAALNNMLAPAVPPGSRPSSLGALMGR